MKQIKMIKKVGLTFLMLLVAVGCGKKVDITGSYTFMLSTEELAGNTRHNGFVTGIGASQLNTLVLKEDGTYEYTKELGRLEDGNFLVEDEASIHVVHKFIGTYTSEDNVVTLNAPEDDIFNENWGSLDAAGYLTSSSGSAKAGDLVTPKEEEKYNGLELFQTEFYVNSSDTETAVVIELDLENGTMTYQELANPEDE